MDYKEKVEWLGRYQASVSCQHMLEEEIEVLRSDAERVTACMSGMPGRSGPNADRLPRAVERIEEAQKRLEQQLEICMETRAEIMCGIMTVRDRPGQEVLRRPLSVNAEYRVPLSDGDVNVICVENGEVYMKEANCRDGLCLRQGRLRNQAGTIVCLPHEVVVKLTGGVQEADDGLDVIIQ